MVMFSNNVKLLLKVLCLFGREMVPKRQRPLLKDTLGARMNFVCFHKMEFKNVAQK